MPTSRISAAAASAGASAFYKGKEKPDLSDQAFIGEEQFDLPLAGFAERFAKAKVK
ncbi:hypothetical protein FHS96_003162 [Sphingomonas zeicaulis]|uniref:hypothetical protein n=1 Tax=Sphingomonas zeicaulis TaxID=1632740 RepID=UPI003D201138